MTPVPRLTNVLHCEDNLAKLPELPDESVDLIYLDPPFFSNRIYEVIFGDEAEIRSFEDRWAGGIHLYLDWMRVRLDHLFRVLKPTGSLYLHCDPSASHYLKTMVDEVFSGLHFFRTEIIWKRSTAHSDTKQGRRMYGRVHDVLLLYTKSDKDWTWNVQYQPYDPKYVATKYKHVEEKTGRRYRLDNLTGPGGAAKGNPQYEVMGVTRYWRYSKEKMEELIREGRVVQTKPGGVPQYKRYLDEMKGVPLQDVWTDIDPINSQAAERLGWPTQKPEALLERIIRASSNEGDIVLDPFCGCGTAIAVAQKLDRRWVGIDIAPTAIKICDARMRDLGAEFLVLGMPETVKSLMQLRPFEFQNWVINQIHGKHSPRKTGDMGIDGYSMTGDPVQVKRSRSVGRGVIDTFQTAVVRAKKSRGFVVAGSFTKGAHEEAARAKRQTGIDIRLVPVGDLFDDEKMEAHGLFPARLFRDEAFIPEFMPEARPTAEQLVISEATAEEPPVEEPEAEAEAPEVEVEEAPRPVRAVPDLVDDLLEAAGIHQPPVPLEPILESLNIELAERRNQKEDALLIPMTDPSLGMPSAWVVYYNPDKPEVRRRFTIAHEVGHVMLHGVPHAAAARGGGGRFKARERQVERFAAELLMPPSFVRAAITQYGLDAEKLAALFRVSQRAMQIRLQELGFS